VFVFFGRPKWQRGTILERWQKIGKILQTLKQQAKPHPSTSLYLRGF
jgi:hypothetical protein